MYLKSAFTAVFAALATPVLASAQTPVDSIVDDANSFTSVVSCNDDELVIQVSKENPASQRAILRNTTIANYLDVVSFDRKKFAPVRDIFVSTGIGESTRSGAEWKGFSSALNIYRFPALSSDFIAKKVHVFQDVEGVQLKIDTQGHVSCGRFNFQLNKYVTEILPPGSDCSAGSNGVADRSEVRASSRNWKFERCSVISE